jgi:hypothetical protein
MKRLCVVAALTLLGAGTMTVRAALERDTTRLPAAGAPAAADSDSAALQEFQKRLKAYLELRAGLSDKLEPLASTPDASELAVRQESLAAAIQTARKDARPGDVIPPAVAEQIRRVLVEDFRSRSPEARRAALGEVPDGLVVAVNRTYPKGGALPTMPPLLLGKLPPLPDNLQYRFADRHLVLLDGDTQLIVDYVSDVLSKL